MGNKQTTEMALEKKSRRDYRRAVDKIVTEQVKTIVQKMTKQRNIFRMITVFSVPLNIVAIILLVLLWKK